MTELELFEQSIPTIAEMVVECKKMSPENYMKAKEEILHKTAESASPFISKIFIVIDSMLQKEGTIV